MASPEHKNTALVEGRAARISLIEKGTVFFVYCNDCKQTLYCALEESMPTFRVAQALQFDHGESFQPEHNVSIIRPQKNK